MLKYRYLGGRDISSPIQIEPVKEDRPADLQACLERLFPDKALFFSRKDHTRISIMVYPQAPFGPDPELLLDHLFEDFAGDVASLGKALTLKHINIYGLDREKWFRKEGVRCYGRRYKNTGKELQLDLVEFSRVCSAFNRGVTDDSVLVSVFLGRNDIRSFLVPEGTSLMKIFEKDERLLQELEAVPDNKLFHPLTGREFDPEKDVAGIETGLVVFSRSGFNLAPPGNIFLPFPYYNHRISMRRSKRNEPRRTPCQNCLSCAESCPSGLFPSTLFHCVEKENIDRAADLGLALCIRCGNCSFVCPASLPLASTISGALAEISEGRE